MGPEISARGSATPDLWPAFLGMESQAFQCKATATQTFAWALGLAERLNGCHRFASAIKKLGSTISKIEINGVDNLLRYTIARGRAEIIKVTRLGRD